MTPALDLLVWSLVRTALLLTPLASIAAGSAPQMFDASTVGGPVSNAPAEIYLPAGSGPFPAMVVLHGCDGVGPHYRDWARRLAGWGYVAVLVDSFRPRGVPMVCNHGLLIPPVLQAEDALAAADYLRSRADVRAERIGVIGFSHGVKRHVDLRDKATRRFTNPVRYCDGPTGHSLVRLKEAIPPSRPGSTVGAARRCGP